MPHQFNTSICLIIKDENEYINEWLDWHIKTGFNHFYIYDNGSQIAIKDTVKEEYKQYCTFIDFSVVQKDIQTNCYKHALDNFRNDTKWMAFIDTDEFIRVIEGKDINEFLKDFEEYDGIYIRWLMYGANGLMEKDNRPQRERFTEISYFMPQGPVGKSIIQTQKIDKMGHHFPFGASGQYNIVDSNKKLMKTQVDMFSKNESIIIDHYYTRSYEEWKEKLKRRSCDIRRFHDEFFYFNPYMRKQIK